MVHNGIISNYSTLKDLLVSEGYVFLSQTDTEVVPKLMDYLYRKQGGNVTMPRLAMQVRLCALLMSTADLRNEVFLHPFLAPVCCYYAHGNLLHAFLQHSHKAQAPLPTIMHTTHV